jgi:hypothetical protein
MADKAKKRVSRVEIVLNDEKPRWLYYTLNDVYEMQQASASAGAADPRVFVHHIWLGLRHDEPELTEAQVMALVDAVNLDYYVACLAEATNPTAAAQQQYLNGAALPSIGNSYAPSPASDLELAKANSGS